jgi:hypothetical protein
MNFIKLFDQGRNEVNLNIAGIGSSSFLRYEGGKVKQATVFMLSGEKHIFIDAEGDKLDAKMIELGLK